MTERLSSNLCFPIPIGSLTPQGAAVTTVPTTSSTGTTDSGDNRPSDLGIRGGRPFLVRPNEIVMHGVNAAIVLGYLRDATDGIQFVQDLSNAEIAEGTGLTEGTVRAAMGKLLRAEVIATATQTVKTLSVIAP